MVVCGREVGSPRLPARHVLRRSALHLPIHLTITARPLPPLRPTEPGRWDWIGEGEDEQFGWIPDRPTTKRIGRPKTLPKVEPKGIARGERAGKAKLTADDVRAIRALANGDRSHGSETSQKALAARYGISPAAVRKIITRQTWHHVTD